MEEIKETSDQFNELEKSTDDCLFVIPVCDQSSNKVRALAQDKIQSILANTLAQDSVMFSNIVEPIHVQPVDEGQVPTKEKAQVILMDTPILSWLFNSDIVKYEVAKDK